MKRIAALFLAVVCAMGVAAARVSKDASGAGATPQSAAAPPSGARAEFLEQLEYYEQRFVRLAEAIPAEKYTWRLGEGVRPLSEDFLHVAAANYNLCRPLGTQPPAGFDAAKLQTSTSDKTIVIQTLKDSFAHVRGVVTKLSDTDVDKPAKLQGRDTTYRGVLFFMVRHWGEQLGQLVAYGRVNGVVPPWTEEQQRQQKAAEKPKP